MPDVGFFARRLENDAAKWGVPLGRGERLFLVTEEQELLDGLIARFPDAKHVAKERFSCFKPGVSLPQRTLLRTTMEENNMLYLLDLYALSRCDYLVGPMNGGMQMALNLNGNRYKAVDIIDIGTY